MFLSCFIFSLIKIFNNLLILNYSDIGKTNAWSEDHHTGAFKFHFPPIPFFGRGSSTETDSLGNLFVLRLLEVMHTLGYEFILSSDLSSIHGQSSLFFRLAEEVNV